jgi:hypothetical protein
MGLMRLIRELVAASNAMQQLSIDLKRARVPRRNHDSWNRFSDEGTRCADPRGVLAVR